MTIQNMIQFSPQSKWWAELIRSLNERFPNMVDDVLKWCFPYILPFKNLRVSIFILRGPTLMNGHPGTLLIAGNEYKIDFLTRRFFDGEPQREKVGELPLWNLARTLKRLRTSVDLTIVHLDRLSACLFFDSDYLAVPTWVGSTLTVPEDVKNLLKNNRNLKEDLRIVGRNKLSPEITQDEKDFEVFYKTMYVPFIRERHGEQAHIHDFCQLRRRFRRGGLLWVLNEGKRISGVLFERRGKILRSLAVGMVNWELGPRRTGAIVATYLFIIDHAKKLGCMLIDFGGSRPSLADGVLRYKRKWGVNPVEKRNILYDFLIHWNCFNRPVNSFLSNLSLIFRDQGGLSAITIVDRNEPATQTEAWKAHHSIWMTGLQRLYIVAPSGWQTSQDSPPKQP
jgi:hypothetical protein